MKLAISKSPPESFKADIIAMGCYERSREDGEKGRQHALIKHADGGIALDRAMGGALSRQIAAEKFTGERGTARPLFTAGKIPARFILLVGLGARGKCDLEALREAGARMSQSAREVGAASVALVLERGPVSEENAPARAKAIAEGAILGAYRFDRYKTNEHALSPAQALTTFLYQGDAGPIRDAIDAGRNSAEAACACRDLVNMPASDATPRALARRAREIALGHKLHISVMGPEEMQKEGMNGILAVAKGSGEPPVFISMTYRPKEKPRHSSAGGRARARIALVGKGITFDSGGISLKQPRGMEQMKGDMAGAAAVLTAMDAIAKLEPPVEVTAFMPTCENLPDGRATRPGDIITARNGKTIEIVSTDAEGRLLLADALSYAADKRPDAIVDVATLTGGAAYCCGELYTIVLGNDQKLVDRIRRAADACGEPMWQLPIVEAYRKGYTSGIADMNNVGKGKAQTILGAIFLKEFVGDIPWAHLDIGASFWTDEDIPLSTKGATGAAVRTLVSFVMGFKKGVPD